MFLAFCLAKGEDEVICDLAETYHILYYKRLPPSLVATLVIGLSDSSRIKRKISGMKLTLEQSLLALIADGINTRIWQNSKDGQKNRNRPDSILRKLMGTDKKIKHELMSFRTPEEYERWYKAKMR